MQVMGLQAGRWIIPQWTWPNYEKRFKGLWHAREENYNLVLLKFPSFLKGSIILNYFFYEKDGFELEQ